VIRRLVAGLAAGALLAAGAGCAARRGPAREGAGPAPLVGYYSGRLEEAGRPARGFRVMLFVEAPDRIHAEVLSPLGTPELVLDGGAGLLAVTLVDEGRTYAGPARPEALFLALGLPIEIGQLVEAVRTGEAGDSGWRVTRAGPRGSLPETLELAAADLVLTLRRKRLRVLDRPRGELGTGRPPAGVEARPLDEFVAREP